MLALISPAKTLDYETPIKLEDHTQPRFLDHSHTLIETLKPYSSKRVAKLMNLSSKLSDLNVARYRDWHTPFTPDNARQSILAFKGDVYIGLDASTLTKRDLNFAQKHLRILSGLYGVLRPYDLMQPYRLEMGTKIKNPGGKNLYEFWAETITDSLNEELNQSKGKVVVNLASNEYFNAVDTSQLNADIVAPAFLDEKNGEFKMISFFAKKARGSMARYLIQERVKSAAGITGFDRDGYRYDKKLSTTERPVFTRTEKRQKQIAAAA